CNRLSNIECSAAAISSALRSWSPSLTLAMCNSLLKRSRSLSSHCVMIFLPRNATTSRKTAFPPNAIQIACAAPMVFCSCSIQWCRDSSTGWTALDAPRDAARQLGFNLIGSVIASSLGIVVEKALGDSLGIVDEKTSAYVQVHGLL